MTNKLGIYYAYWTHEWEADFVPFVSRVKQLGFDVLEVNAGGVTDMARDERLRLKEEAQKHDIELTYCIGLPPEYDTASPDPAIRRNGIDFLKRQAEMMVFMEGRELGGIIYGGWPASLPDGETKQAALERSADSIREVVAELNGTDIVFNVEVVNRFEQFLLNTAEEAVTYCRRVDSPHCKLLLDTFHMNIEEDSFRTAIATAGDRLGHVHLGETNRRAPGRGKIPWDEVFGALHDIGYGGPLTMEPFLMPGGTVGRNIAVYRDLRNGLDLDEEAQRACSFVKDKLAALS